MRSHIPLVSGPRSLCFLHCKCDDCHPAFGLVHISCQETKYVIISLGSFWRERLPRILSLLPKGTLRALSPLPGPFGLSLLTRLQMLSSIGPHLPLPSSLLSGSSKARGDCSRGVV